MLINKGVTIGEVVTLRLISGEEIIGKLIEEMNDTISISKPMMLSMGSQGLGMIPFVFSINPNKNIKLYRTSIILMEATDKQFADQYLSGTSGLALL